LKTAQLKAAVSSLEGQIAETTNAIRELKSQLAFAIQMSGKNANKGG
jgi:peptidoglycan hydrolase CwlO-like protein